VKPIAPQPSAEAVEQGLSRPQADLAHCDHDNEMDCFGDGNECVPIDQLCDGQQQCSNGEDENPDNCAYYDGKLSPFLDGMLFLSLGMLAFLAMPLFTGILLSLGMLLTLSARTA